MPEITSESVRATERVAGSARHSYQDERAGTALDAARRMSRFRLTMAWWGCASGMVFVYLGADVALRYGTVNALIGMCAASVVFGVIGGVLAGHAVRTGSSSSVLSRVMLGPAGGAVPALILSLAGVYYAVFEGSVLAVAAVRVIPALSYREAALIVVLYSAPLAIGGVQRFLDKLNGLLLPFYLGGLLLAVTLILTHTPHPIHSLASLGALGQGRRLAAGGTGIWRSFVAYFGLLVLTMVTMEFARFGRVTDERYHVRVAFGVPFYLLTIVVSGFVGIVLVAAAGPAHVTETSVVVGALAVLGSVAGLLWVFATQTRINSVNFYVSALNLQAALEELSGVRVPGAACILAVAAAVLGLMCSTDVFAYLLTALAYQAVFITAWVGVALIHIWRDGRRWPAVEATVGSGRGADAGGPRRLRFSGMAAWLVAAAAGTGLMLAGGALASLSAPATLVLAAGLTLLLRRRTAAPEPAC